MNTKVLVNESLALLSRLGDDEPREETPVSTIECAVRFQFHPRRMIGVFAQVAKHECIHA